MFVGPGCAADPTFSAQLERGPCLGLCPSYRVGIDAAGGVVFSGAAPGRGDSHPPCLGEQHWRVAGTSVEALERQIDASGFFALRRSYRAGITDQSQYVVTIRRHARTKAVVDYVGRMVGMPKAMTDIEDAIDQATDDQRCLSQP